MSGGERDPNGRGDRAEDVLLPREVVLASAGTGKTFRIASRIIGLLLQGEPPDQILASTFTRKAAGEILSRVLERLARAALDENAGTELFRQSSLSDCSGPAPDQDSWLALLLSVLRSLHRVEFGTLDSFFIRTAGAFHLELGLPSQWGIGEESTINRLESEALLDVLTQADRGEIVELVRMLVRADASRGVHLFLLERARELRRVLRQIDPAAHDPWRPLRTPDTSWTDTSEAREGLASDLEAAELPRTGKGEPDGRFRTAVATMAERIRAGDWEEVCVHTLAQRATEETASYYQKPFTPALVDAVREATRIAVGEVAQDLTRRSRALQRLATDFDVAMRRRQREEGLYRFEDVTIHLGGANPLTARADLWYRLDHFGRHLLLDEFQDTSLAQWRVLEPLVQRLLAESAGDRSLVVVADPKQSIYGWRGAEPDLVRRVRTSFPLQEEHLADSYRSSPVILRFVNRIFQDLPKSSVWTEAEEVASAEDWIRDFQEHRWIHDSLPGHVRVVAGPRDDNVRATARPRMMRRAAELVAELREEAPGASIGVLVRHNIAVAHLVAELRSLGVPASEEGGTRPADSPAVAAVLSLLTLADHPSHTLARYHVAKTPLGALLSFTDFRDDIAASHLAQEVRKDLMVEGYGETLTRWVRTLAEMESLDRRDLRRLLQLVELAHRWDPQATLRPGDFVRFAETSRMEDPETASIRVMTIHQAKGLEFDIVILPELDLPLGGGRPSQRFTLVERSRESGWIQRVFPYVKGPLQPFFPDIAEAAGQARAAEMRDVLGVLYVALTRARHALHLLVTADGQSGPSSSTTGARLIRLALGVAEDRAEEGEVLFEDGDAAWYQELSTPMAPPPRRTPATTPDIHLVPRPERSRFLPHRTPSSEEGGSRIDLRRVLRFDEDRARRAGLVAHAWLRRLIWIEDPIPDDLRLRETAGEHGLAMAAQELKELMGRFREWLEAPEIRKLLSQASYPPGTRVRTEISFARRTTESVVRGQIDRLVLVEEEGSLRRAEVIDFKTDRVSPEDKGELRRLIDFYRPQVEAYRDAVAFTRGLAPEEVSGRLAFLSPGVVVDL